MLQEGLHLTVTDCLVLRKVCAAESAKVESSPELQYGVLSRSLCMLEKSRLLISQTYSEHCMALRFLEYNKEIKFEFRRQGGAPGVGPNREGSN